MRSPLARDLQVNLQVPKLGRREEAVASYNQAIKLKPDFSPALQDRGDVLLELGRDREAIASYEKAVFVSEPKSQDPGPKIVSIYRTLRKQDRF